MDKAPPNKPPAPPKSSVRGITTDMVTLDDEQDPHPAYAKAIEEMTGKDQDLYDMFESTPRVIEGMTLSDFPSSPADVRRKLVDLQKRGIRFELFLRQSDLMMVVKAGDTPQAHHFKIPDPMMIWHAERISYGEHYLKGTGAWHVLHGAGQEGVS